jgi:cytochrome c553
MTLGKTQYALCMGCHGPEGQGMPNVGPPLANSEWVTGPIENLIGIQLRGLKGPITINGQEYNFPAGMMAMGAGQSDENIAAVLTYIRNSFGNQASAVTPEMVAAYREANKAEIEKGPLNQLTVKELKDPFAAKAAAGGEASTEAPAPAPKLPEIPSSGLGASGWGIFTTVVIVGLTAIAAMRMKKNVA